MISHKRWPCQPTDKCQDAYNRIDRFTSIAPLGVTQVVKLNQAEPHRRKELIAPNLIDKVDNPTSDIIHKLMM